MNDNYNKVVQKMNSFVYNVFDNIERIDFHEFEKAFFFILHEE